MTNAKPQVVRTYSDASVLIETLRIADGQLGVQRDARYEAPVQQDVEPVGPYVVQPPAQWPEDASEGVRRTKDDVPGSGSGIVAVSLDESKADLVAPVSLLAGPEHNGKGGVQNSADRGHEHLPEGLLDVQVAVSVELGAIADHSDSEVGATWRHPHSFAVQVEVRKVIPALSVRPA